MKYIKHGTNGDMKYMKHGTKGNMKYIKHDTNGDMKYIKHDTNGDMKYMKHGTNGDMKYMKRNASELLIMYSNIQTETQLTWSTNKRWNTQHVDTISILLDWNFAAVEFS